MTRLWLLLTLLFFASGCAMNYGRTKVVDGEYVFEGRSTNPEKLLRTVSRARVDEINAQSYARMVEQGMAYPCPGCGTAYGSTYQGLVLPPELQPGGGDTAALQTAEEAKQIAQDSILFNREIYKQLKARRF